MNIDIANRLYEMRKRNNFSQEELAEKIGVSRQAVSKWERAEASPDTDNLILLSKLYGISMDELLSTNEPVETASPVERQTTDGFSGNTWLAFPYPILITIIYLFIGFVFDLWHPAWLLFVTIPIYYSVAANLGCKRKRS